jgi:hypothetical protein
LGGDPGRSGETMTAKLNGFARTFNRFDTSFRGVVGYGTDGSLDISVPSLAPAAYACPAAKIDFNNSFPGALEFNQSISRSCCTIQISRSGAIGEPIEGTFSAILINDQLQSWIKIEEGHFLVMLRAKDDGGTGDGAAGDI